MSVTRDHDKNLLITSKKQEIHECNVEIEKTKHEIAALHTEIIKIELKMPKDKRRSSYVQNAKGFNLDSFKTKEFDASAPKDMLTPEFVSDFMKTSNAKNQEDLAKANKKLKAAEKKLEKSQTQKADLNKGLYGMLEGVPKCMADCRATCVGDER